MTPQWRLFSSQFAELYYQSDGAFADETQLNNRLHPEEISQSRAIKAKRRRLEYLRARYIFHQITGEKNPLLNGTEGFPLWPNNWRGSISHKTGHILLGLCQNYQVKSIGVDLEQISKVNEKFAPRICQESEIQLLKAVHTKLEVSFEKLLALVFSYKEAIFKCHFPLGKTMFYFHDAEITTIDLEKCQITARLKVDTSSKTPKGTICQGEIFEISDDLIATLTYLI